MKIKNSILKTSAVLMAAAMAASPITVKAYNYSWSSSPEKAIPAENADGIAEKGVDYKMPSYSMACNYELGYYDEWEWKQGNLIVYFDEELTSDIDCYGTVPEGYKGVAAYVQYEWWANDEGWEGSDLPDFYFSMDAENCRDWTKVEYNNDGLWSGDGEYVTKYNFTLDCGGITYPECWAAFAPEGGIGKIEMVVPSQYDGALTFTMYGVKLENGGGVVNEAAYITGYLQGNGTAAVQEQQPAEQVTEQQPAEQPTEQQPAETATEQQPAEPTAEQQPLVTERSGSTYVTRPGDNLMKIAKELYGDKELWTNIYEMNKDLIRNPNVIFANMELKLP